MNIFPDAWGLVLPVYIDHFKLTTQLMKIYHAYNENMHFLQY